MEEDRFLIRHIIESLLAGLAEAGGSEEAARRLRSQARLRLLTMTPEEKRHLAGLLADRHRRPVEQVYADLEAAIDEHRATADEWVNDLKGAIESPQTIGIDDILHFFPDPSELERRLASPDS